VSPRKPATNPHYDENMSELQENVVGVRGGRGRKKERGRCLK